MRNKYRLRILLIIFVFSFFQEGCAVLNLPFRLVEGTFKTTMGFLSGLMKIADKLPKPPPGVF